MRTVNFRTFFEEQFLPAIGKDPADFPAGSADGNTKLGYVNDALVEAWQYAFWPEIMVIESRTLTDDGVLDFDETGKTEIHSVYGTFSSEANAITKSTPLEYEIAPGGLRVFGKSGTVYVRLRPLPPVFSRTEWGGGEIYSKNARVYSPESGNVFRSRVDDNEGNYPEGDTTNWEAESLPEMFVPYLKEKAKAAYLYHERKYDAAGLAESRANTVLFNLKKSKGL